MFHRVWVCHKTGVVQFLADGKITVANRDCHNLSSEVSINESEPRSRVRTSRNWPFASVRRLQTGYRHSAVEKKGNLRVDSLALSFLGIDALCGELNRALTRADDSSDRTAHTPRRARGFIAQHANRTLEGALLEDEPTDSLVRAFLVLGH